MVEAEIKTRIREAINGFSNENLSANALKLFQTLGYNTDRQNPFTERTFRFFKEEFLEGNTCFNEEKAKAKEWKEVDLLFQLTKDEVAGPHGVMDAGQVNRGQMESYLFFAIELTNAGCSRTTLAQITRQVNKVFAMPVMILFKTGGSLTLAIIDRRLHKRDERKDVLEKVTLIKDIDIANPHRAHIEILFDLSLDELRRKHEHEQKHKLSGFEELHKAWRKALDTQELNELFFKELSDWYFWAMQNVSFPDDVEKNESTRNATSLIRLITRIVFIWFIKEKKLVPDVLFDRKALGLILKEFSKDKNSHGYYQAILQNLFFGTLNQEMNERGFVKDGPFVENRSTYGVKNLFRYADRFSIGEDEALALFKDIPFLNGGLFDCLDKENDEGKVQYADGFSRNPKKQAIVPDFLFFGPEEECDLNAVYDTKNKKYEVKGLIHILSGYKFTISENTPVEEEIALDPELLGKVFENLLASYNPETHSTARKRTGSFYTPREIVDYMVDESLMAILTPALSKGEGEDLTPALSKGEGEDLTPALSKGEGEDLTPALSKGEGEVPGYITTSPDIYKVLKPLTIENRQHATEAEAILWEELRNRKLGFKFRRQHPVDKYIVDFICLSANLVIEADGDYHNSEEQRESDKVRTERLQDLGYRVLRFKNESILKNIQNVLSSIKTALSNPPSPLESESGALSNPPSPLERGPGGEVKLRHLLSYSENPNPFNPKETEILIKAIDACKILDPACGSGAFPMGILHKLVHILHQLDPGNKLWKDRQIEKVLAVDDAALREHMVGDIEAAFENNELDYGRKLYLIENCIYGVDIQPIAIQISKLRFFISLIVDEDVNRDKENYGVRSLPNLETKFIAANTLIGLDKPEQRMLKNPAIDKLEKELKELRHRYFSAKNRTEKLACQKKDKTLRLKISDLLVLDGFPREAAKQIADFDPYDQNASSPFFDFEWMFGLKAEKAGDGVFDIVIGNPPYVQIQNFSGMQQQKDWERQNYETYARTGDVYCLFYERGYRLLTAGGVLTYITSNKWQRANYGKAMRKFFMANGAISQLIDFGDSPIFKNATTYTNILVWHKVTREVKARAWDLSKTYASDVSLKDLLAQQGECEPLFNEESFLILTNEQTAIKKRITEIGVPLKDWNISINYGIKTGLNEAFIIDRKKKDELIARDPKSADIIKPILRGRDIKRNKAEFANLWVIIAKFGLHEDIKKKYPVIFQHLANFKSRLEDRGQCRYGRSGNSKQNQNYPGQHHWLELDNNPKDDYTALFNQDKIVWAETSMDNQFCLVGKDFFLEKTSFFLVPGNKYLLGVLNSHVTRFFLDTLVSKMRGGYFSMSKIYIEQIPIPHIAAESQLPFEILVDMILFAIEHGMNSDASTLEWVIDVMTYGLYFEPEMKKSHCYINDRIAEFIKPFTPVDTDDFKTEYIKTFIKFCDKDDTIRHGLVHSHLVKPVQVILGDKK
ncbi:MAG: DUF559 domain-containing protein [Candidatus Aminicenantes bacterium]|nr:DUF559 domain-containing protein [Candidatus Aminicenantes bacterium]